MNSLIGVSLASRLALDATRETQQAPQSQLDALMSRGKEPEDEGRLGNFEIQRLMSQYNQAEQLASSVMRKQDDAASDQCRKIG